MTNMAMIFLISAERFIYIRYPLTYHTFITTKKAIGAVIITWIVFVIHSMVGSLHAVYLDKENLNDTFHLCITASYQLWYLLESMGIFTILSTSTVIFYIKIALIAKESVQKIIPSLPSTSNSIENKKTTKIPRLKTRMFVLVLGSYFGFYLPAVLVIALQFMAGASYFEIVSYFSWLLFYCNNFINPLIYVWYSKDFRMAFHKLLFCK